MMMRHPATLCSWIVTAGCGLLAATALAAPGETEPTSKEVSAIAPSYGWNGLVISKVGEGISNLVAADIDGDGRGDLAVVHNGGSKIELLVLPKEGERPGDGKPLDEGMNRLTDESFYRRESVAVEERVYALLIRDFDRDGRAELAWTGDSGKLTVARRGDASYEPAQRLEIDKLSNSRTSLASGDVDGDSREDLVVLGIEDTYVFRQGEDGRFLESERLPNATRGADELVLRDVDGDGMLDLLYVSSGSEWPLRFRFGKGGGAFGPELRSRFAEVRQVAVGELDGKPGAEAVAVRQKSGRLALLRYGRTPGEGEALAPPRATPLPAIKDQEQREFVLADIDGDGTPELLVAEPSAAQVIVHRGLMGGTASAMRTASFVSVSKPRLGDLDGDGAPELVVAAPAEKAIGVSAIDPEDGPRFPRPLAVPGGWDLLALDVADVDADGKAEILVVAADGRGRDRKGRLATLDGEGTVEADFDLGTLKKDPNDLWLIDLDRDGRRDAVLFVPQDSPRILLAKAEGGFVELDAEQAPGLGILKGLDRAALAYGDVDGDGAAELVVPKTNFVRALFLGSDKKPVTVLQANLDETSAQAERVALLDLDADGVNELLVFEKSKSRLEVYGREGEGHARRAKVDLGGVSPVALGAADLDADGRQDALFFAPDSVAACRNGAETLGFDLVADLEIPLKRAYADHIALGDVNGDGVQDAVLTEATDNQLVFVAVRESALEYALRFRVFETRIFGAQRSGREPREVLVAECTGDDKPDVAVIVHDRVIVYPQE
jgi:hypothetical protein